MKQKQTIYHWQSQQTGEIVKNFAQVLRMFIFDLKHYKFLNIIWTYKKAGY